MRILRNRKLCSGTYPVACLMVTTILLFTTICGNAWSDSPESHAHPKASGIPGSIVVQVPVTMERSIQPKQWGIGNWTIRTYSQYGTLPTDSTTTYGQYSLDAYRYRTGGNNWFARSVELPQGSIIGYVRAEVCDEDPVNDITLALDICPYGNLCTVYLGYTNGSPGCTLLSLDLSLLNLTVQNAWNSYGVSLELQSATPTTRFRAIRVFYKLQVSPAPATATFTDVPTTHAFFQYVEALAASGITSGCSPTQFCPSQPVTRGQMAAFLARALGLYWPD